MTTELPAELLRSLRSAPGFDEEAFVEVHHSGVQVPAVRVNPFKFKHDAPEVFEGSTQVPWSSHGCYLPQRPSFTLDPRLHAGVYYVQEPSSMFLEQCIVQCTDVSRPLAVLDLCAAPGGKSTLLQAILSTQSLLVSNEVIKNRVSVLAENLVKWGAPNVIVTNNDPADFKRLNSFFDVMVVDAPCSGSGLFRRDPDAISEWSKDAVNSCSLRQQRILADAYDSLKEGGLLIYSTCSFSMEEDEQICDWLMQQFDVSTIQLKLTEQWNVVTTVSERKGAYGYRFYPDKIKGEGFFVSCFRKNDGGDGADRVIRKKRSTIVSKQIAQILHPWLRSDEQSVFFEDRDDVIAFPQQLASSLETVISSLYIKRAGIRMGKLIGGSLVPHHELALSTSIARDLPYVSLKKDEALQYLRKEEVSLNRSETGWFLARYEEWNLGWIKLLGNRSNNYYPKEWRIRKSGNN